MGDIKSFVLRCPADLLGQIDIIADRENKSRHAWVISVLSERVGNIGDVPKETEMPQASVALDGETQSYELAADRAARDCPRCHKVRVNRGGVWWCPQHGAEA